MREIIKQEGFHCLDAREKRKPRIYRVSLRSSINRSRIASWMLALKKHPNHGGAVPGCGYHAVAPLSK
jgi:hypothetical protein